MIRSTLKPVYRRLAVLFLPALICVICIAYYARTCSPTVAQPIDEKVTSESQEEELPKIGQVLFLVRFSTEGKTGSWVGQARLVPANGRLRMENVKTLFSGGSFGGIGAYRMSPDGKHLLVARMPPDATDEEHRDLLLVSLPTGETKTVRGDGAGYHMLGWSSDGHLISYVSPIPVPYSLALAPASSNRRFVSYVSHQNTPESRHESPTRVLYISAPNGRWRRKLQAEVTDAVWIPGHRVIVYSSYEEPGLVAYSADGRKAVLFKGEGGGDLLLSGDGRKLLWASRPKLRLLQVPANPSKLLDPKAWKTVAKFDLDPRTYTVAGGLSSNGTMVTLLGPSIDTLIPGDGMASKSRLAVLNLVTGNSTVFSFPGSIGRQFGWSRDDRYLVGALFQPGKGGGSADLAAIRVDSPSITHSGPIDWGNPQPVSPRILLEMPVQTRSITWSESAAIPD